MRLGIDQYTEQRIVSGARVAFDPRGTAQADATRDHTMSGIEIRKGMRVRCIDASGEHLLEKGRDYLVTEAPMRHWITIYGVRVIQYGTFRRARFKPVILARCRPLRV